MFARIESLLQEKAVTIGDELELVNGSYLERDYIPVYVDNVYFGHLWKYRDITEKKKNEEEKNKLIEHLNQKNEQLEDTNKALSNALNKLQETQIQLIQSEQMASIGRLTAGIAHELNNPMGFISNGVEAIEHTLKDFLEYLQAQEKLVQELKPAASASTQFNTLARLKQDLEIDTNGTIFQEFMSDIKEGVQRASAIISGLQHFSFATHKHEHKVDLHQSLNACIVLLDNKMSDNIILNKKYTTDNVAIYADANKINQVFLNVLSNAIDAIEDVGNINIETAVVLQNIMVQIKDSGKGIAADELVRIFEPFYTTKEVGKGTGLGLSISYNIMKEYHGQIDAISEPGQGTIFTLTFPLPQ